MKSGFHLTIGRYANAGPRSAGFTLLELLTVMTIMGFIMSIAVASFYHLRRGVELRAAVSTLRGNFARARENAIFKQTPTRVRIVSTTSYAVEERRGGVYSTIGESERALPPGVKLEPQTGYLGTNSGVVFDPDGRTDSLVPYKIRLGEINNPIKVDIIVNGLTGLTSVEYFP